MKIKSLLLLPLMLPFPCGMFAADWNVSIKPFLVPGSFDFTDGDLGFRFAELASWSAPESNTATHMIVTGLSPATGAANVHASNYEAINISNGGLQDAGVFYVKLPEGIQNNAPALSSAIVGVVPRQGPWSDYSPSAPSQTTIGGSIGTAVLDGTNVALNVERNGQSGSTTIPYAQVDGDTIELGDFNLNFGGVNYAFEASVLVRDGDRFSGAIASADPVEYQSLMFVLELSGGSPGEIPLLIGGWINDHRLGYLYGAHADWTHSLDFGWLKVGAFPWIYHPDLGWLHYRLGGNSSSLWFYSPELEWIYVPENRDGTFLHSSGDWASGNFF